MISNSERLYPKAASEAGADRLSDAKPALPKKDPKAARLTSLDAYRGLVMLLMMGEVLQFYHMAEVFPHSAFWRFLASQQTHSSWVGCSVHDLIQPSFSFLVGVALPFSLASRLGRGQSRKKMAAHAVWRSIILILLGVFLRSIGQSQTYWTFEDTLTQIGLGYFFLFLLGFQSVRRQWAALGIILIGYWAAFLIYPAPRPEFDFARVGVPAGWPHLMAGINAHWNKNSNLAWAFDTWFLNLFPRSSKFVFNEGGYATLSFLPTLGTMILGLIAGGVLRGERTMKNKAQWLAGAGVILILAGLAVGVLGICPIVKRIWTPSWVLFSGGLCFVILTAFHVIVDIKNWKGWTFPLVVVGVNSIAAYCLDHLFEDFIHDSLTTHLGTHFFDLFGAAYAVLFQGAMTLAILWLLLCWMYSRKIFLKV